MLTLLRYFQSLSLFRYHEEFVLVLEFPYQKESISDVLVCRTSILVDNRVSDFSDLIDEHHDLSLQDFCGISEVSYVAETKDGEHSLTCHHWVDITSLTNILGNNFGPCVSEPECEQMTDLDDGLLKNGCLVLSILSLIVAILLIFLIFLILKKCEHACLLHFIRSGSQRVFRNQLHNLKHSLNWVEHKDVGIVGEVVAAD